MISRKWLTISILLTTLSTQGLMRETSAVIAHNCYKNVYVKGENAILESDFRELQLLNGSTCEWTKNTSKQVGGRYKFIYDTKTGELTLTVEERISKNDSSVQIFNFTFSSDPDNWSRVTLEIDIDDKNQKIHFTSYRVIPNIETKLERKLDYLVYINIALAVIAVLICIVIAVLIIKRHYKFKLTIRKHKKRSVKSMRKTLHRNSAQSIINKLKIGTYERNNSITTISFDSSKCNIEQEEIEDETFKNDDSDCPSIKVTNHDDGSESQHGKTMTNNEILAAQSSTLENNKDPHTVETSLLKVPVIHASKSRHQYVNVRISENQLPILDKM